MGRQHTVGTSVVDIWAIKKKRGKRNWNVGKRWLGRAQIKPGVPHYRTKAFEKEEDAWEWAESMVAKLRLGLESGVRCTIRGLMDEYTQHLTQKGCSPKYVDQAKWILERATDAGINDLRDERLPAKVEHFFGSLPAVTKDKRGYTRRQNKAPLSPCSRNSYLAHVLALCAYARKRRYIPADPLAGIVDRYKVPKKAKAVFSLDELRALVSNEHRGQRFWLPMVLMVYTGMRLDGEMVDTSGHRHLGHSGQALRQVRARARRFDLLGLAGMG